MTGFAAFLRGVNLGKRTVRSADLKAAFEAMGFADARTLIASGNVLFSAGERPDMAGFIEQELGKAFGFPIGVVLRSRSRLQAMIAADPFAFVPKDADAKLYVTMLGEPRGEAIKLPFGKPGDYDVVKVTDFDIFAVAWKMDNGRYGEGLDTIEKTFPKGTLVTTRNWNTIVKAAAIVPGEQA